ARFTGPRTVAVGDRELEADRIFINTGGRAHKPQYLRESGVSFLTSARILALEHLPEHLLVVGGSYIGLEFAQAFRRLGSAVTVIQRGPRLVKREDPDVSEAIQTILENEGIQFRLNAACTEIRQSGSDVIVGVECSEGPPTIAGSHLLMAVGRDPNSHELGLDAAGIAVDEHGYITVNDQLETNVPGVWALGDVNGRGGFTHTAYNDYEIVAANLFDRDDRKITDRILTYAIYIDPPLGRCGMTEAEARTSRRRVLKGFRKMEHVSRARERSETDGFMKVLVDADTKEILGGAILGIRGDEVSQALLTLMALHRHVARRVHPPHGDGIAPDDAAGVATAGVDGAGLTARRPLGHPVGLLVAARLVLGHRRLGRAARVVAAHEDAVAGIVLAPQLPRAVPQRAVVGFPAVHGAILERTPAAADALVALRKRAKTAAPGKGCPGLADTGGHVHAPRNAATTSCTGEFTMEYIDPTKVASDNYKLLLENDHVRLIEMTLPAGQIDNEHSHRDETVYFIKGGKARIHLPGGETAEVEVPDGGTMWHEAWTHRVENIGDTDIHAIIFEPK
ncbi:MAG: FAD-dependent oxidoreductase, partial [Planctomycetota bacterium]